ncbi:BTAD domain-containing putative transcriptional regulator [Actinophytocola glycyrrhizae]|uniref:BTAD domain-containing putative transcriptional regulator n=1 Tax=Actinophytocola glycyrrhizae TaxID=2044873 RepID=A0ABV9SF27_9PSEU
MVSRTWRVCPGRGQVATATKLAAAGETRAAVDALRQALALWRPGAFAGSDSRVVREHALLIDEERPVAWKECMRLSCRQTGTARWCPAVSRAG